MHKRKRMIIVGLMYAVIVTVFFVYTFNTLVEMVGSDQVITPIRSVDDEERYGRPYSHIEPISSSNITIVEDLYEPKYFDNDNITVLFPTGDDLYFYHIGYSGQDINGDLRVFRSNGSQIWTVESESSWSDSIGRQGGSISGRIAEHGTHNLRFTGRGYVLFLSSESTEPVDEIEEFSIGVGAGKTAFYVPRILTQELPADRRLEARVTSEEGLDYKVRYYDEELHLLGEVEGTGMSEIDIPVGYSDSICVVVETEGNVIFQFSPSEPIMGEMAPLGWFLLICYLLVMGFGLTLILLKTYSLEAGERILNRRGQHQ